MEITRDKDSSLPQLVQHNLSYSKGYVLRGMHFQDKQWQVLTVLKGRILDITIDISPVSQTFLTVESNVLSNTERNQLIIPPNVAHGFCALEDETLLLYQSSVYYGDTEQHGVSWKSEQIFDLWPIKDWVISDRDKSLPSLSEFLEIN